VKVPSAKLPAATSKSEMMPRICHAPQCNLHVI
jgi:hypothetical protein